MGYTKFSVGNVVDQLRAFRELITNGMAALKCLKCNCDCFKVCCSFEAILSRLFWTVSGSEALLFYFSEKMECVKLFKRHKMISAGSSHGNYPTMVALSPFVGMFQKSEIGDGILPACQKL
ncbi:hypothetical protein TNCT_688481 [Trichonephila clavata]|uniref:Uncharacterized protein n=1 Tax=Trichonephila clavata TaxID=2740835 RepID=A0A8X6L612_TRICU|nr:hypothetical protein TNCT_688481 [Trichonephila clavata]